MQSKILPRTIALVTLLAVMMLVSGCSLLFGGNRPAQEPTPEADERVIVPTFTPTPELPPTATPEPTPAQPTVVEVAPAAPVAASEPATNAAPVAEGGDVTNTDATTNTGGEGAAPTQEPAPTPTPLPKVVVTNPTVNARNGPGTEYGLVGALTQGQSFDVTGKNPEGTWWQFCCVNGQPAWVFGELVSVENGASVPVAQNIPAPPPVAVAPPAQQQPAEQPPAQQPPAEQPPAEQPPAEEPPAEPAPPAGGAVNAGPCGGDDGCKFRITGGPTFLPNGGGEMKLQLFFKHSGVDGGQPQGDYRLAVEKDGQLIVPFADARSIALSSNNGPSGKYNYEAKVSASSLPGGTLEGNYFFWVLDGNRERDSEVFQMYVPPGQGEIWIEFDQG
jgi:uncharacterized protein YraI